MSQTMTQPPVSRSMLLRLGARGSMLSLMQSGQVAEKLKKRHPFLQVPLCVVQTSGDRITEGALHEFGGKGLFTRELEQALLDGRVDFAVHSLKDVPVTMPLVDPEKLVIAAVPVRENPRDVLVSLKARRIADLPQGAKVGTGSLRRQSQILALRPDVKVSLLRGNVDTRIRKLKSGDYDAVILAMAGLVRSGLFDEKIMTPIGIDELLPAAGQGALALQCRRGDEKTAALLRVLDDRQTHLCVDLERAVVARLNGDCHSPIAAYATVEGNVVNLAVAVARRDGQPPLLKASAKAGVADAQSVVEVVIESLMKQGVVKLLSAE
jgi:hydroxymethylbilane synthase